MVGFWWSAFNDGRERTACNRGFPGLPILRRVELHHHLLRKVFRPRRRPYKRYRRDGVGPMAGAVGGPSSFKLSWIPWQGDIGTHSFYIEVCDGINSVTTPVRTLTVEKRTTSLSLSAYSSEVRLGSSLRFQGIINLPITGVAVRLVLAGPENRSWQSWDTPNTVNSACLWKTSPRMISDSGGR